MHATSLLPFSFINMISLSNIHQWFRLASALGHWPKIKGFDRKLWFRGVEMSRIVDTNGHNDRSILPVVRSWVLMPTVFRQTDGAKRLGFYRPMKKPVTFFVTFWILMPRFAKIRFNCQSGTIWTLYFLCNKMEKQRICDQINDAQLSDSYWQLYRLGFHGKEERNASRFPL